MSKICTLILGHFNEEEGVDAFFTNASVKIIHIQHIRHILLFKADCLFLCLDTCLSHFFFPP